MTFPPIFHSPSCGDHPHEDDFVFVCLIICGRACISGMYGSGLEDYPVPVFCAVLIKCLGSIWSM